jgi:hypothetical protein
LSFFLYILKKLLNSEPEIWLDIRYPASQDIRYPAFRLAEYPAKSGTGAFLIHMQLPC